jgi:hypothetical protein
MKRERKNRQRKAVGKVQRHRPSGRSRPQRTFEQCVTGLRELPSDTPELTQIFNQVMNELRSKRRSVWSLGLLYRQLKKSGAAERGHFDSAEQWWEARLGAQISLQTARKYMMLVRELDQQATVDFDAECLFLYLRWCHKTKNAVVRSPADEMIPILQDGSIVRKRFADCNEREMKSALHALAYKKDPGMGLPAQLTQFMKFADANLGAAGEDEVHKLEGYMLGKEPRIRMDFSVYDLVEALKSIVKSTQGFPIFSEQEPDDPDADDPPESADPKKRAL